MQIHEQVELCNHCFRMWNQDGFGMSSTKTPPLSEECKEQLRKLAAITGVRVEFIFDDGQHYVRSYRTLKR
jgi:hypothetical protein